MLLAAMAMTSSPALAAPDTTTVRVDVPPVTVPPVTVAVVETPVDQIIPPGIVPEELPKVEDLAQPLTQVLSPSRPAPAAPPAPSSATAQGVPSSPSASPPTAIGGAAPSVPPPGAVPAATVAGSEIARRPGPGEVDLGQEALRTAGRFWFPLAIAAALIAFVTLQWFVDRRDPKLAAAPLADEILGFS